MDEGVAGSEGAADGPRRVCSTGDTRPNCLRRGVSCSPGETLITSKQVAVGRILLDLGSWGGLSAGGVCSCTQDVADKHALLLLVVPSTSPTCVATVYIVHAPRRRAVCPNAIRISSDGELPLALF